MLDIFQSINDKAAEKQSVCHGYAAKYCPSTAIQLLLVGESPPLGPTYFYIPEDLGKRHRGLPAMIFRALFKASTRIDKTECESLLQRFRNEGYLLTDLVRYPIDCFVPKIRMDIIKQELAHTLERINALDLSPSCTKILILPSGTHQELISNKNVRSRDALEKAGFRIIKWSETEKVLTEWASSKAVQHAL